MLPGDETWDHPFHQQHRSPSVQTDQENLPRWPDPNPAKASASTTHHLLFERISEMVDGREHDAYSSPTGTLAKTPGNIRRGHSGDRAAP